MRTVSSLYSIARASLRNHQQQLHPSYSTSLHLARGSNKSDNSKPKYTKSNLPSKVCQTCARPFEWRKKWESCWDDVKYCSDRCRGNRNKATSTDGTTKLSMMLDVPMPVNHLGTIRSSRSRAAVKLCTSLAIAAAATTSVTTVSVKKATAKSTIYKPTEAELKDIFRIKDWSEERTSFSPSDFSRLDESSDTVFYQTPRFVEHIDETAVRSLTYYHDAQIRAMKTEVRGVDVLDLCSSHVSHISIASKPLLRRVTGLGMNRQELDMNPMFTESGTVQDLNERQVLPFADQSFDIVLLQLSIDYLTHPISVLSEAARVLRPGGLISIAFSNRVFIDKAVAVWTGKSDLDHMDTIGDYVHLTSKFDTPTLAALDLLQWVQRQSGKRIDQSGDPMYAVTAKSI